MCIRMQALAKVTKGRMLFQVVILTGFLASSCAAGAANYFPLENGNRWNYVDEGGRTAEVVARSSTLSAQNFTVENYLFPFDPRPLEFFTSDPGETWESFQGKTGLWYPWWRFEVPVEFPIAIPEFAADDCVHGTGGTFLGLNTVTVPAGVFTQVAVITYTDHLCEDSALITEILAPGVGLIQRRVETFAGQVTWSLDHAIVGGRFIGSGGSGRAIESGAPSGYAQQAAMRSATTSTWGAIKSMFTAGESR